MKSVLFSLLALSGLAAADFSGTWVLNKAKSDFGAMPEQMIPEKMTRVHAHSAGVLTAKTTQSGPRGEVTSDSKFKLDGSESVNGSAQNEVKTIATLEGDAIVMKSTRKLREMNLAVTERYELAAGGASMTVHTTVGGTPMGDIVMKYVFDRAGETASAAAPGKPDFNGRWKLNKARSSFGQMPEEYQPSAISRAIQVSGQVASVQTEQTGVQGSVKSDLKLKLDGTESVNQVSGAETRSVAKWDGNQIQVVTKRDMQGMALEISEKWALAADGKTMDVDMKIGGTPLGDIVMKYVFEKE